MRVLASPTCYPTMTETDTLLEWLKDRRLAAGLGQDDVDRLSTKRGVRISQSYLSQIERGIKPLSAMGAERMSMMRELYQVSPEEWAHNTGLSVVVPSDQPTKRQERYQPVDMPTALQAAVDQYGDKFPDLQDEDWQRTLSSVRFMGGGPRDADGWLQFYLDFRKHDGPRRN